MNGKRKVEVKNTQKFLLTPDFFDQLFHGLSIMIGIRMIYAIMGTNPEVVNMARYPSFFYHFFIDPI